MGGDGPAAAAVAYVESLDGSERAVLLRRIAADWPEVVDAAAELVARWRADCAERRKAIDKRKAKDRRRRQRQAAAKSRR